MVSLQKTKKQKTTERNKTKQAQQYSNRNRREKNQTNQKKRNLTRRQETNLFLGFLYSAQGQSIEREKQKDKTETNDIKQEGNKQIFWDFWGF